MKIPKIHINTVGDENVLLTIEPPEREKRGGMDVVCVIDVSGSMQVEASMKDEKGDTEQHGLSILDVVKHAVKTIIKTMKPNDRLSIVTFSTEGKVVFGLIPMNERGSKRALRELKKLEVETQTNLWDGLFQGMEIFRKAKTRKNHAHLLLFTDGLPNVVPPRGHAYMVEKYLRENPKLGTTLHFVGFGYSLDSKLLEDLARVGGGMYNYIPDSSFVGTVFVNAISNVFSTLASNISLSLEPLNGASIEGIVGEYPTSEGNIVRPGSLFYGQRKDIMLRMKFPREKMAFLRVKMSYEIPTKEDPCEVVVEGGEFSEIIDVEVERLRLAAIDSIRKALHHAENRNDLKAAQQIIDDMVQMISASRAKGNEYVKGLCKDLNGQVTLALSRKEWFERWGGHYLRSLLGAHLHKVCNNFKDPGVQLFGGKLFKKLRDEGEEVFSKLPPPKAPPVKNPFAGTDLAHLWQPPQRAQPARNFSMRRYYNVGGGCIAGSCEVKMGNGSTIFVKDLRKGDVVQSASGKNAKVVCAVQTLCEKGKMKMVQLNGGLTLTPYHPVLVEGRWRFPKEIGEEKEMEMDCVYDFVLDQHHTMVVNGMEVVSFGHEKKGSVVEHAYFGSKKIIQDLEKLEGWKNGFITLRPKALKRDKISNLVTGIDKQYEVC